MREGVKGQPEGVWLREGVKGQPEVGVAPEGVWLPEVGVAPEGGVVTGSHVTGSDDVRVSGDLGVKPLTFTSNGWWA